MCICWLLVEHPELLVLSILISGLCLHSHFSLLTCQNVSRPGARMHLFPSHTPPSFNVFLPSNISHPAWRVLTILVLSIALAFPIVYQQMTPMNKSYLVTFFTQSNTFPNNPSIIIFRLFLPRPRRVSWCTWAHPGLNVCRTWVYNCQQC